MTLYCILVNFIDELQEPAAGDSSKMMKGKKRVLPSQYDQQKKFPKLSVSDTPRYSS